MTAPQNLDFADAGPAPGIPEGWNLYGRRTGSPTFAAFATRARDQLVGPNTPGSAPWALTGLTVSVGAATAPDGSAADVVYETAVDDEHCASIALSGVTALAVGQYAFGAYVKPIGGTLYGGVSYYGNDSTVGVLVDFASGRLLFAPTPLNELLKVSGYVLDAKAQLAEQLEIELAGASTDIRVTNINTQPVS